MKMPPMKAPKAKMPTAPTRKMGAKPHIRMQKLKPVPPSAFPQAAAAFPSDGGAGGAAAMPGPPPGGMPTGAAPGDMGE